MIEMLFLLFGILTGFVIGIVFRGWIDYHIGMIIKRDNTKTTTTEHDE